MGHRRILLAALCRLAERRLSKRRVGKQSDLSTAHPQIAERRQLTVLFSDLVGSTELAHHLDPEDLREFIQRYQDLVAGVVARYGGYVANFVGDGIVAYFGWPRADEDEAVQAVRAGLAVTAAVRQLRMGDAIELHARVGIASGRVVVGDLESAGVTQAGAISGETPNLAARVQTAANEDQVVIAGLTRQLIGATFDLDELGERTLKGITTPVALWQVLERKISSNSV